MLPTELAQAWAPWHQAVPAAHGHSSICSCSPEQSSICPALPRAAWHPATLPASKTGVSMLSHSSQMRNSASCTLCASSLHSQGRESLLHNVIMLLIFEMQGRQGTAHLVFITVYKQWQNNLQMRETDLIRHIRVQTHTLAGQTGGSVPAFSKCLTIQERNILRKQKSQLEAKVQCYQ